MVKTVPRCEKIESDDFWKCVERACKQRSVFEKAKRFDLRDEDEYNFYVYATEAGGLVDSSGLLDEHNVLIGFGKHPHAPGYVVLKDGPDGSASWWGIETLADLLLALAEACHDAVIRDTYNYAALLAALNDSYDAAAEIEAERELMCAVELAEKLPPEILNSLK